MTALEPASSYFVGRHTEIRRALALLDFDQPIRMLHFSGAGGIGKTRLLEALRPAFVARGCEVPDLIDLQDFAHRSEDGLLNALSSRLGPQTFPRFAQRQALLSAAVADLGEDEDVMLEAFVADFAERDMSAAPIVLRFDTLENIQRWDFARWVLRELLPRLGDRVIVFTAGREPIPYEFLGSHVEQYPLDPLTIDDAIAYTRLRFEERGRPSALDRADYDAVYELAEGRPILIALATDWMFYNHAGPHELVERVSNAFDTFEREMVAWVRELPTLQNTAILHMAVVDKGVDERLLAHLMEISDDVAKSVLENLSTFTFIKHSARVDRHEYTLHDEMCDLVAKYVGYPPGTRRMIAAKAAAFYEQDLIPTARVAAIPADWPAMARQYELRNLEIKRVYYLFNATEDIDLAFREALALFDKYADPSQNGIYFCQLIIEELANQQPRFAPEHFAKFEVALARLHIFRKEYEKARTLLGRLGRQHKFLQYVRGEVASALAKLSEGENVKKSKDEGLKLVRDLEQQSQSSDSTTTQTQRLERARQDAALAQEYRNLATRTRLLGKYDEARDWNERSLVIERRRDNKAGIAACLNNIANVDRLLGNYEAARRIAFEALELREQIIPRDERQIGLSYSTIGLIERDAGSIDAAIERFKQALRQFEVAGDDINRGKALANLGSISYWREIRQSGLAPAEAPLANETNAPPSLESAVHLEPEHYLRKEWTSYFIGFRWGHGELRQRAEESRAYLDESEQLFVQWQQHKGDLAETLNHKGRLLVHLSEWYQARQTLQTSLALAREVGLDPLVLDSLVVLILIDYLKKTPQKALPLIQQVREMEQDQTLQHYEPFSRLELILGNIEFERAESDLRSASYKRALAHYIEACGRALLFSHSSYAAAKYVLHRRLLKTPPEFIAVLCQEMGDFWRTDRRGLHDRDPSMLVLLDDVLREKLGSSAEERT